MIYPNIVVGQTLGTKSVADMQREQQMQYWQRQSQFEQERKAGEPKVLVPVQDRTGLVVGHVRVGKSSFEDVPQSGISQFANRMAIKSQVAISASTGIMPTQQQVQRAHQGDKDKRAVRKQDETEQPDVAQEIETLKRMVSAISVGLASALKQTARQQPDEQPDEQPKEKAMAHSGQTYVQTGFGGSGRNKYPIFGRTDFNPSLKGEHYYKVGKNEYVPVSAYHQLPTSPITGQPSQLRQIAERKAGLVTRSMVTRKEDCQSILGVDSDLCDTFETETKRQERSMAGLKSDALRRSGLVR